MNITIGSAPDSWGIWFGSDEKQTPWQRFLDEIVEAGYEWTELGPYGYLPTDPDTLKQELNQRNLKVSGTFMMKVLEDPATRPDLEQELDQTCDLITRVDGQFLVLIDDTYSNLFTGESTAPKTLDDDAFQYLTETVDVLSRRSRDKFGVQTVFHPHAETHVEYENQIERLLEATDPGAVSLCLDTGHHAYRGGDPVSFMRRHHERIPYLHLKSIDQDKQAEVERAGTPFAIAVAEDMFCEPSRGAVDFVAFRDLLNELDYAGYAIVEQDMYPAPFDKPLPIAKRTREYLQELGIG